VEGAPKIVGGSPAKVHCTINIVGKANFLQSPQISNPQILWLIALSQIRKFLRYASQQIANPQIFIINPQIATPQISKTIQLCLKTVLKVVFYMIFMYTF
jgi:hypothetical protein